MVLEFDRDTMDLIDAILEAGSNQCSCSDNYPLEKMDVGESFDTSKGVCTKVAQDLSRDFNLDYNTVWMVFEIDGRHFRLTGWKSSYGTSHWNDYMESVDKKEETRVFYE